MVSLQNYIKALWPAHVVIQENCRTLASLQGYHVSTVRAMQCKSHALHDTTAHHMYVAGQWSQSGL